MSAWAGSQRERAGRATLAASYVCVGVVVLLPLFAVFGGGTGLSWISAVLVAMGAFLAAVLVRVARATHANLREIRTGKRQGSVTVYPDHCRIHFPGVLGEDLVLAANRIRAVCVDDRRPAWAALYWCRFMIKAGKGGSDHASCLFRPCLPNALQLLAPAPGVPNIAVLFTRPLRVEQATGLGAAGESLALITAQLDDVETAADLPGARPVDPDRAHPGLFLKVDSAAAARKAFADWPVSREVLEPDDVRLLRTTPVPTVARKVAGAVGFAWLVGALAVTVSAVVTRSWSLVVPLALIPTAIGGLTYETFRSLRAFRRPRAAGATVLAVTLMVATAVIGVFEIRDLATFDDPPPEAPPTSYYIPEDPFPDDDPFPSDPTRDPFPSPDFEDLTDFEGG